MRVQIGLLVLFLLIPLACNFLLPSSTLATPNATSPMTQDQGTSFVRTLQAEETKLATFSPTPAPSVDAGGFCVIPRNLDSLNVTPSVGNPQAILDYLNAGATPGDLERALINAGVASQPIAVAAGDMTGDGEMDVVVSIIDPTSSIIPIPGILLIYLCQGDHYGLIYQRPSDELEGSPRIWYLQDLNADGLADLVVSASICGAHTCFEDVQILVWNREAIENRLQGDTEDLPYPEILVTDQDGDSLYELHVTGTGFGSVGAGPQRPLTRTWSFMKDRGNWELISETLSEPIYRFHILLDADQAARSEDFERALTLYQRVVDDATLQDWIDPVKERASLGAYARFKMVVIHLLQGRVDAAQQVYLELNGDYGPDTPQYVFVEMATVFRDAYKLDGVMAGCQSVRKYVDMHSDQVLPAFDFGYGNPQYTAEDICP